MLTAVVLTIAVSLMTPAVSQLNAATTTIYPPQQTVSTVRMFIALMGLVGLVTPYLARIVIDLAPSATIAVLLSFTVLGIVMVICALLVVIFVDPHRDSERLKLSERSWTYRDSTR